MSLSTSENDRLETALEEYFKAVDAGDEVDQDGFLERYADIAGELRDFFAQNEGLNRMAEPLRPDPVKDRTPTLPLSRKPKVPEPRELRSFGDYQILGFVAQGGMGVVYRARQAKANRIVALKMIRGGSVATREERVRFRIEAESAAQLDHPNIVPIYEVGDYDGQPFFSMKWIDGGSLSRLRGKFLTRPKAAVRLLKQVAEAVHYAHQHGILHRDLKPDNILLGGTKDESSRMLKEVRQAAESSPLEPPSKTRGGTQSGQAAANASTMHFRPTPASHPYVTDFGLAKRIEEDSGLTESGAIVGTPSYMSPEQAAGNRVLTTATDVYSLGAILYEMLSGKKPFQAETPMATLLAVQTSDPTRLRSLNSKIDPDLETICMRCLEKDPKARYATAGDLAEDLGRWLEGEPIHARPLRWHEHVLRWAKRNPAVASLLVLLVFMVTVGLVVVTGMWRHAEAERMAARTAERFAVQAMEKERATTEQLSKTAEELRETVAREKSTRIELDRQLANLQSIVLTVDRREYCHQINIAQRDLWAKEYGEVIRRITNLTVGNTSKGCFEQNYLIRAAQTGILQYGLDHQQPVTAWCFSPDGKNLVTASGQGTVLLWDLATRESKELPLELNQTVTAMEFTWEGDWLACGLANGEVAWWNLKDAKKEVKSHVITKPPVVGLVSTPKGIFTAVRDKAIYRWDEKRNCKIWCVLPDQILALSVSPEGKKIAALGNEWALVFDVATPLQRRGERAILQSVLVMDDGRLYGVNDKGDVSLTPIKYEWQSVTGRALTISANVSHIASLDGRCVRLYDLNTSSGKQGTPFHLMYFPLESDAGKQVRFSHNGHFLATDCDKILYVWDGRPLPKE